ncbi:MAG: hypothetical protein WBM32_08450 [Crocosphaera sp.]
MRQDQRRINKRKRQGIVVIWKQSLEKLLDYYQSKRGELRKFFPKLFFFFVVLNISCYWWAMLTAYPHHVFGDEKVHYFLIQFPIGFLGALFDSLSFFVTVYIARKALKTTSTTSYLAHLSVDIIIAILATWWVLFVFSVSGWLVSFLEHKPESLVERSYVYEQRFVEAVQAPTQTGNMKNIYFGIIMGISAMLPTFTHLSMSVYSVITYLYSQYKFRARR